MVRTTNDPLDFAGNPANVRPPAQARHPLGLPAGSVRSFLTLMVMGLIWALILQAGEKPVELPLYLVYLLFLIVGSFFAAHGNSIAGGASPEPSPWHLPRGTVRFLIVLGFAAVIGWRYWKYGGLPDIHMEDPRRHPYMPLWILGGFFAGMLLSRLVGVVARGPYGLPSWYQDVLAWVSLLAVLGLAVEVIVLLIINPSRPGNEFTMPNWQTFLSAIISLYFGARS